MRQKYKDINIHDVDLVKYPLCQIKYDGIWCKAVVNEAGTVRYFSRNGQLKKCEYKRKVPAGEYIGELMFGSEWSTQNNRTGLFYVFDILSAYDTPYVDRYKTLRILFLDERTPSHWLLVTNYSSSQAHQIWESQVATGRIEGLVFRSTSQLWTDTLLRAKYSAEIDLRIVDFTEGKGKHSGKLGSVEAVCEDGITHTVGGGFSDSLRETIWRSPDQFLNKTFVAEYKKKFASGKLRHPNFSRWHAEK